MNRDIKSLKSAAFVDLSVSDQERRIHLIVRHLAREVVSTMPIPRDADITFAVLSAQCILRVHMAATNRDLARLIYGSWTSISLDLAGVDQDMVASLAQMACEAISEEKPCAQPPDTERTPVDPE